VDVTARAISKRELRRHEAQESIKLLEEVNNYSERYHETATGLETWFALPTLKTQISLTPPPRWKMAIVVFIAAYAISSLSRFILNPLLEQWPLLGNTVIYTAILVASLTYFAMPVLSRLLRQWLYPKVYNQ
jgi:antibiotic biosynthesis monooxygenase (ABM) superfamily enzyme